MSIEFDIKKSKSIDFNLLKKNIINFVNEKLNVSIDSEFKILDKDKKQIIDIDKINQDKLNLFIEIGDNASVWLLGYYAGDVNLLKEEGGDRLVISSGHLRTKLSFFLLLIVSGFISEMLETYINDDTLILNKKNEIFSKDIFDSIDNFLDENCDELLKLLKI